MTDAERYAVFTKLIAESTFPMTVIAENTGICKKTIYRMMKNPFEMHRTSLSNICKLIDFLGGKVSLKEGLISRINGKTLVIKEGIPTEDCLTELRKIYDKTESDRRRAANGETPYQTD